MMGGFQYFLKSSVVMLWTGSKQVWRSADDGSTWKSIVPDAGAIYVLLSTTRMRSKSTCLRPRRYWSRTTTGKPLKVVICRHHPTSLVFHWWTSILTMTNTCMTECSILVRKITSASPPFTARRMLEKAGKKWILGSTKPCTLATGGSTCPTTASSPWPGRNPCPKRLVRMISHRPKPTHCKWCIWLIQIKKSVSSFSTMSFNSMWWNNSSIFQEVGN
ncbi:MAG: hypothetical protein J3Q66DRAFT_320661, partial [Benniella sp.]